MFLKEARPLNAPFPFFLDPGSLDALRESRLKASRGSGQASLLSQDRDNHQRQQRHHNANMRLQLVVSLLLTFICSLASAADLERSIDIFAWPLSASKPQTLAKVSFTANNASIKSFNSPSIPGTDEIVRVGFYHSSGSWSGIATAASNFAPEKSKKLQLHVKPNGELYHVGFKAGDESPKPKGSKAKENLLVEVVKMRPGPTPQLNKPVVVREDGSEEGKEPEKTFLQKYVYYIENHNGLGTKFMQILVGNRPVPAPTGCHGRREGVKLTTVR